MIYLFACLDNSYRWRDRSVSPSAAASDGGEGVKRKRHANRGRKMKNTRGNLWAMVVFISHGTDDVTTLFSSRRRNPSVFSRQQQRRSSRHGHTPCTFVTRSHETYGENVSRISFPRNEMKRPRPLTRAGFSSRNIQIGFVGESKRVLVTGVEFGCTNTAYTEIVVPTIRLRRMWFHRHVTTVASKLGGNRSEKHVTDSLRR